MGEFCESEVEKGVFFSFPFREITIGGKSGGCKGGGRMPRATACLILLCDKNLALMYLPGRRGENLVFMFLIAEAFFFFLVPAIYKTSVHNLRASEGPYFKDVLFIKFFEQN